MAGRQRPVDVGQNSVRGNGQRGTPGPGDDAIGAVERAAVLDLDEGARSVDGGPSFEVVLDRALVRLKGAARARLDRLDPRQRRQLAAVRCDYQGRQFGQQPAFGFVVEEPRGRIRGCQRLGIDRDRAAGDEHLRVRAGPAGPANDLPGLAVGDGGHGAGVDDHQIRGLAAVHQLHTTSAQEALDSVHLGLVDLAAEVGDRGTAHAIRLGRCNAHD